MDSDPEPDPAPLVRGTDPRIRIRTKMSLIPDAIHLIEALRYTVSKYQEFMSLKAAEEALPKIVAIMADELGWDDKEKLRQTDLAIQFLRSVNPFFIAVG